MAIALSPLLLHPTEHSIVWREAEVNCAAAANGFPKSAAVIKASCDPHGTFSASFGDLTAIYRTLGVPLRDTLTGDNDVEWDGAIARPDLFLHTDWAVVAGGDTAQGVIKQAYCTNGPRYELVRRITVSRRVEQSRFRYMRTAVEANVVEANNENSVH